MQINLTQKAVKYFDEIIYVPVWAKYLAVDSDGTLTAYEKEPQCCECLNGDGYWVMTEPGYEIDICMDADLEGMDFKETCVNIESEVDDELLHTMRTYFACRILPTETLSVVNDTGTTLFINGKPINCLTQEELEMRQTDIFTLCRRIKDAYEEGVADRQWNAEAQTDQQLWNASKAKRIYDILIKQAMEQ